MTEVWWCFSISNLAKLIQAVLAPHGGRTGDGGRAPAASQSEQFQRSSFPFRRAGWPARCSGTGGALAAVSNRALITAARRDIASADQGEVGTERSAVGVSP